MGYGGAWVGHWLTRGMGKKHTPMGYGGAWVGGHELTHAIESPTYHLASPPHARLQTHAKGATPKPKPQPKPPGWWLRRFPQPMPQPKPHTPHDLIGL
ncbi:hypothetical protein Hanom_Chr04g00373041 [Helianthus anomalus]